MLIRQKFIQTIRHYGLFEPGDRVLIAFSGGADSTALLSLLMDIKDKWDFSLFLGHFNHKLRKRADEDQSHVMETGRLLGIPVIIGEGDVRAYAARKSMNIEEAGRLLRYQFLREKALEIHAQKIATAHTQNDQAETFLMRLMRGSGRKGLSGIFLLIDGIIVRPLLGIDRAGIEAYLKSKKLAFCVDESNFNRRYLRNRVRLELIPFLQKRYEPRIVSHLAQAALLLQEEESLLREFSEEAAAGIIRPEENGNFLEAERLSRLPKATARRLIRKYIEQVKGNLNNISRLDVEAVLHLQEGKKAPIKKNLVLFRERNRISLLDTKAEKVSYSCRWGGTGHIVIPEAGLRFSGQRLEKKEILLKFDNLSVAFLDMDRLIFPLEVRNRRDGDRYQPCGAPGRKKLKEIFRAKNIPPSLRDRHPVFVSGGEIVWVFGLPVSEKHKITDQTRSVFVIRKSDLG